MLILKKYSLGLRGELRLVESREWGLGESGFASPDSLRAYYSTVRTRAIDN